LAYNEYKMSPTSISGGGNLLTGGELISPASLKGQEEVLPSAKLEQWPYKDEVRQDRVMAELHLFFLRKDFTPSAYVIPLS